MHASPYPIPRSALASPASTGYGPMGWFSTQGVLHLAALVIWLLFAFGVIAAFEQFQHRQGVRLPDFFRHTRQSRYPLFSISYWIPAYAGMTKSASPDRIDRVQSPAQP